MEPLNNKLQANLAEVALTTVMAQSLNYCLERKYLEDVSSTLLNRTNPFLFNIVNIPDETDISWLEIEQIGRPVNGDSHSCFTAVQKILHSCHIPLTPLKTKLHFLIIGDGSRFHLYLGVSKESGAKASKEIKDIQNFAHVCWPGLRTKILMSEEKVKIKNHLNENYENISVLTGIPTLDDEKTYPSTVEQLMGGSRGKKIAYLIVAEPLQDNELDNILFNCREIHGQAETLKNYSVSETNQQGLTKGWSRAISEAENWSKSEGNSKKGLSGGGAFLLAAGGILAAGMLFPPALALFPGLAAGIGTGAAVAGTGTALLGMAGMNILSQYTPTKTVTNTFGGSKSVTDTINESTNESYSRAISKTVANKHIEYIAKSLEVHSLRYQLGKATGAWKVGCMIFTNENESNGAAQQIKSIVSGKDSIFEPVRIHNVTNRIKSIGLIDLPKMRICYDHQDGSGIFQHPFGENFSELTTVLTTKELSCLVNFPLRSVPGISVVDSSPDFSLNEQIIAENTKSIHLGKLQYGGAETQIEYNIPVNSLAKHSLISGINGSGKTNTVFGILKELNPIPFLVIEPAKTEYVDWAIRHNNDEKNKEKITIFMPGCDKYRNKYGEYEIKNQLKINPFEIIWLNKNGKQNDPRVLSHIDRLKHTFAAAFPLYDILPVILEDVIYTLYQNESTNWLTKEPVYGKTLRPTLNAMAVHAPKVVDKLNYEQRVSDNLKACLKTRVSSLKRGWKKTLLNNLDSTNWEKLFSKPCVINLSHVGDDADRAFIIALILQFLYEYRIAEAEISEGFSFDNNQCRHLTVIEEAHRVMANCVNPELPQYKAGMMFSNMLSEIRAYGQGLMIVDQVPTRLIPDAIKNTNLKIVHKVVAADDATVLAESMGLSEGQRKIISKLNVGDAIVSGQNASDTYWIHVNYNKQ